MLDATDPKPIRLFPSFITSSALPRLCSQVRQPLTELTQRSKLLRHREAATPPVKVAPHDRCSPSLPSYPRRAFCVLLRS